MTGIVCWRIWSGSLFRSELFGAHRGAMLARRRTSDESLAAQFYLRSVAFLYSALYSCTYGDSQPCNTIVVTPNPAQVILWNKLQQKHLPMPTLVNCSPARDWVISIHFKFHRLRDVRSFVDKCLTGTPGTPLKVFSWIIPVYIRKCLLVSLRAHLLGDFFSQRRLFEERWLSSEGTRWIGNWKSFCGFLCHNPYLNHATFFSHGDDWNSSLLQQSWKVFTRTKWPIKTRRPRSFRRRGRLKW